jgi:hypothetical protein
MLRAKENSASMRSAQHVHVSAVLLLEHQRQQRNGGRFCSQSGLLVGAM